jgi:hypothetical protein
MMKNARIISRIIGFYLVVVCPFAAYGTTFTLSDNALMSLDYNYQSFFETSDRIGGSVLNITDVAGPGVKFDIRFSDPLCIQKFPDLEWVSCIYAGKGDLTGIDIHSYDTFALKFTLLSASGVSSPGAIGPVYIGAAINRPDSTSAFRPELIAYNDPFTPATATSVTTTNASQINLVGFACYIPWQWYDPEGPLGPSPWDPYGAKISLLVEPAPGAVVITPEPATILLLGLGFLMMKRKGEERKV